MFLLRRGHRYVEARAWSVKHMRWLCALGFDDRCSQAAFADYLASVEMLAGRRACLLAALERQIPGCWRGSGRARWLLVEAAHT